MDKYTADDSVDRIGQRLIAVSRAYREVLDRCAAELASPSDVAYDMCRTALVSYLEHTSGHGHPGGVGALIPMLRQVAGTRRLQRISRDIVRASRRFDDEFADCTREIAQRIGGRGPWGDVLVDYLDVTDHEGHPDGLFAWLVESFGLAEREPAPERARDNVALN
jgi:hypothetical protein